MTLIEFLWQEIEYSTQGRPAGVRGRNSDNRLIKQRQGWAPTQSLRTGLEKTYAWIEQQALRRAA